MEILSLLILGSIFMISEIVVIRLRRKWAKQCNYDCSKCKVWDCQRHICLEDLQQRIDKAIEYVEENTVYFSELHKVGNYFVNCKSDELLEILKGSDSNE